MRSKSLLSGALVQKVNASCKDCPAGIDITQANFSISVFAEALVGNCSQVNRLIYNVTQKQTGSVASYSDLWRFTLINYTAGPGCLFDAVSRTNKANKAPNLDQCGCQPAGKLPAGC